MTPINIKAEHSETVVGFNQSGIPLGKRSQEDLRDLAIMAQDSGNKLLLGYFDGPLPSLEELRAEKLATSEKKTGPVVSTQPLGDRPDSKKIS